jgi:hypothetical protein
LRLQKAITGNCAQWAFPKSTTDGRLSSVLIDTSTRDRRSRGGRKATLAAKPILEFDAPPINLRENGMDIILIILIVLLLFGGGFGFRTYGARGGIGIGGILLLLLVLYLLFGHGRL